MALNDGEKNALINQVEVHVKHLEQKLRGLGLRHVKIGLWHEHTRQPVNTPEEVVAMAEEKDEPSAPSTAPSANPTVTGPASAPTSTGGDPAPATDSSLPDSDAE